MQAHLIFWPVLAVLAIPVFVLVLNAKRKAEVRKTGKVDPQSVIDNTAWPLPVVLTSNALANQFQLPVMFYVLCFILFAIDRVGVVAMILAYLFVATRWAHAIVHVTSNAIPLRLISFLLSTLSLFAFFAVTVLAMMKL